MRVSEKTMENSKRLGRQARPGVEPGTSQRMRKFKETLLINLHIILEFIVQNIQVAGRHFNDKAVKRRRKTRLIF